DLVTSRIVVVVPAMPLHEVAGGDVDGVRGDGRGEVRRAGAWLFRVPASGVADMPTACVVAVARAFGEGRCVAGPADVADGAGASEAAGSWLLAAGDGSLTTRPLPL